jgi:predicted Zn-dependent peptidase
VSFERSELPSGIRVVSEVVPGQRSVSFGVWVAAGSRDEASERSGVSHFIEHLVFKGTPSRSALAIAESFDAVGGDLNAYTTKEFTCFHARALGEDLPLCADTIADMVRNASLEPADVEAERSVVLEEIAMHEDTPDDIVFDVFCEEFWPEHPLGRRVQGTTETIEAVPREVVFDHYRAHYATAGIVVAAAGAVDHAELVSLVTRAFGDSPVPRGRARRATAPPHARPALVVRERDIEQAHIVYGAPGIAREDERRWALGVLNIAFGGGMSSRLFQEIRERRGLAYSVSSGNQGYAETGIYSVYAGCGPENARDVLDIVRAQIDDVVARGITDDELERAKGHLRGSLLLSLDEPGALMTHLGKSELLSDEILSADEMMRRIDEVGAGDVRAVAADVLGSNAWALTVLGPAPDADLGGFVTAAP